MVCCCVFPKWFSVALIIAKAQHSSDLSKKCERRERENEEGDGKTEKRNEN
jgi:hypothetical protein